MTTASASPLPGPAPAQVQAKLQALLNGPAGKPPPGLTPNLEHPSNIDNIIIPVLALCLTISTMAVLIRSYTKMFLIRSVAYEDYVIVIAWVGQVGFTVPSVYDFKSGGGSHMWDVRLKDFFRLLYWLNISGILYGIDVCLIKLSILLQYLRIFVPNRKGNMLLYVAILALGWSIFLFYLVDTIFEIVMCSPRERIWNLLMTTGHCFNSNAAYMATGVFNVVSDFSILALPMISIWRLQMPLKRKIMMIVVFATGLGACVTSILRTYYTFKIVKSPDVSYNIIIMGLWTWAEITTGILVSCLPIMPKFFQHASSNIYRTFTSFSKSNSRLPRGSDGTDQCQKTRDFALLKRPFDASDSGSGHTQNWDEAYTHQVKNKGEYITLSDLDLPISTGESRHGRRPIIGKGPPTKREDLETGRRTF